MIKEDMIKDNMIKEDVIKEDVIRRQRGDSHTNQPADRKKTSSAAHKGILLCLAIHRAYYP